MMYQPMQTPILQEKDLVFTVLADLKRVSNEYATAVTESNCPSVRQTFNNLLQDTLRAQEEVYNLMKQQGWYNVSSLAQRQELDKQIRTHQQTQQQTQQFVQQKLGAVPHQVAYTPMQQTPSYINV